MARRRGGGEWSKDGPKGEGGVRGDGGWYVIFYRLFYRLFLRPFFYRLFYRLCLRPFSHGAVYRFRSLFSSLCASVPSISISPALPMICGVSPDPWEGGRTNRPEGERARRASYGTAPLAKAEAMRQGHWQWHAVYGGCLQL